MPLAKQIISWPLTGGLQTKQSPFMLAPGSHTDIVNLRQERLNEWRPRFGSTSIPFGVPGGQPVRATPLPNGGAMALSYQNDTGSAGRVYSQQGSPRWVQPDVTGCCNQSSVPSWQRATVQSLLTKPQKVSTCAKPGGYQLTAWDEVLGGINVVRVSITAGGVDSTGINGTFGAGGSGNPCCVYTAAEDKLTLLYMDFGSGFIKAVSFGASTGQYISGPTTVGGVAFGGSGLAGMDALCYGGSLITVTYVTGGNQIRLTDFNPTTLAMPADATIAVNVNQAIALLPDPDASGVRFIGWSYSGTGQTGVVRANNASTLLTNDVAEAINATNICGVAYQAGAGWMIAYTEATGTVPPRQTAVHVAKKRSGVVNHATILGDGYTVDSGAWREAGTDLMRYVVGWHVTTSTNVAGATATGPDDQHSYYEKAQAFETGPPIVEVFPEAQARLIPLNALDFTIAGIPQPPQVQRLAADQYLTALTRRNRVGRSFAQNFIAQYAVDSWTVTYLKASNYTTQNLGEGHMTSQAAYQPAGALLQCATGASIVPHGGSGLPRRPSLQQSAGGALTATSTYTFCTTMEYPDENGNVWVSAPSASTSQALTGANQNILVTAQYPALENSQRLRTVKIWSTLSNGSLFYLIASKTDTVANTLTFAYTHGTADTTIANGGYDLLNTAEAGASITVPAAHVLSANGRLWVVDRDFPQRVRFSKKYMPGRSPEFPDSDSFVVIIEDEYGPITGLSWIDDKVIVYKETAIYALIGDGPDANGDGNLPQVVRVSTEKGAHLGTPTISLGDESWFFGSNQAQKVDRSLQVQFVGEPIDAWFNQPQVNTPEAVLGMVINPTANEVRLMTTNYRFVYDTIHGIWMRDTGVASALTMMVGGQQMLLLSGGGSWLEGDQTATDDAGVQFQPSITSAWVRPADVMGYIRLYSVRFLGLLTAGGANLTDTPTLTVYYDESFGAFDPGQPQATIVAGTNPLRVEYRPPGAKKRSSFALKLTFSRSDTSLRLDQWMAVVGIKSGAEKLTPAQRWQ